jgi:hypothetical protein
MYPNFYFWFENKPSGNPFFRLQQMIAEIGTKKSSISQLTEQKSSKLALFKQDESRDGCHDQNLRQFFVPGKNLENTNIIRS